MDRTMERRWPTRGPPEDKIAAICHGRVATRKEKPWFAGKKMGQSFTSVQQHGLMKKAEKICAKPKRYLPRSC
jgi:hypothetical protein